MKTPSWDYFDKNSCSNSNAFYRRMLIVAFAAQHIRSLTLKGIGLKYLSPIPFPDFYRSGQMKRMHYCSITVLFLVANFADAATTRVYRNGNEIAPGVFYDGTRDTHVQSNAPDKDNGSFQAFSVSRDLDSVGLLRFDDLFGDDPGQIPFGSQIEQANLWVKVQDLEAGGFSGYRLLVPFTESSTYNSLNSGVTVGLETQSTADFVAPAPLPPTENTYLFNVTEAVRSWASGTPNYGWAFVGDDPSTLGLSSELFSRNSDSFNRPELSITFSTVPEPATFTLALAAACVATFRRKHRSVAACQTDAGRYL